jgi:hypothetical protein
MGTAKLQRMLPRSSLTLLALYGVSFACSTSEPAEDPADSGISVVDGGAHDSDARAPSGNLDLDACFQDLSSPSDGWFVEVQSFETADGSLRIRRARQPGTRNAVGETFAYDLIRFGIESDTEVHCETRSSRMSYEFGHHNWNEIYEAATDAARYVVRERFGFGGDDESPWEDTLEVFELDGTRRSGPQPLIATGCYSLPYNLNPCLRRTRTDQPQTEGEE